MSLNNFLSYLQQLLTMVDPENPYSVGLVKTSLSAIVALAKGSQMVDAFTMRVMIGAEERLQYLIQHADDFKGKPGEYEENRHRRKRLELVCYPHC